MLFRMNDFTNSENEDIYHMRTLRVALLAFRGAGAELYAKGRQRLTQLLPTINIEFVETEPDALFFLSGGSEANATTFFTPGKLHLLLAYKDGNSYAAATEVQAYARQQGYQSLLLDLEDDEAVTSLHAAFHAIAGVEQLRGQRLGLIGEVSDWLVASRVDAETLRGVLGVELAQIPWNSLPSHDTQPVAPELLAAFNNADYDLAETSKVYNLLKHVIEKERLNAITVECFSLVQGYAVTACLPLALLNASGFPAGCEGDLASIAGMMFVKAMTGIVPWMANTVKIQTGRGFFAHCTIAPNLLKEFTITTHFETGKGTAIQGAFEADEVTLFRLDASLRLAFVTSGKVLSRPREEHACRTQLEIELSARASKLLRELPLGNHHLICPGNLVERLQTACRVVGINVKE